MAQALMYDLKQVGLTDMALTCNSGIARVKRQQRTSSALVGLGITTIELLRHFYVNHFTSSSLSNFDQSPLKIITIALMRFLLVIYLVAR
jgi:hypothetical protein